MVFRESPQFVFQSQIIRNHSNKLAIRGLSTIILNGVPKVGVEGIHVAPIPGHLDGVADGALHTGGGGGVLLGHRGVEHLGHGVDHVGVLHRQQYGGAEVLVALDVGGHPDLVDDLGHLGLDVVGLGDAEGHGRQTPRAFTGGEQLLDMLQKAVGADGLDEAEGRPRSRRLNEHILIGNGGGHDEYGRGI